MLTINMGDHYEKLRLAGSKADFDNTMITIVHTGSIQDQILLKWIVSRQLNNVLVFSIKKDDADMTMNTMAHPILFDGLELVYDYDEKSDVDKIAERVLNDANCVDTSPSTNIIILTSPTITLLNAVNKHVCESKGIINHNVVICSNIDSESVVNYKQLFIIDATSTLNDETQKTMSGLPKNMSIDPLFFIYIILWIVNSPTILDNVAAVTTEEDGKCRHVVTLKNIESAVIALSHVVQGSFSR
jgi:hypothetical protein